MFSGRSKRNTGKKVVNNEHFLHSKFITQILDQKALMTKKKIINSFLKRKGYFMKNPTSYFHGFNWHN